MQKPWLADRYIDILTSLLDLHIKLNKPFESLSIIDGYLLKHPTAIGYLNPYKIKFSEMAIASNKDITSFKVPEISMHYFLPVLFENSKNAESYMVDTGATFLSVPTSINKEDFGDYLQTGQMVNLKAASGNIVTAEVIVIHRLRIGPIILKDVKTVLCNNCPRLLGQSVLTQLNTQTKQISGTNFLVIEKR